MEFRLTAASGGGKGFTRKELHPMWFKKSPNPNGTPNRRMEDQQGDNPTIIAATTAIQGTLSGKGTLHMAGILRGDVRYTGLVWIGESGKVEGSVHAARLIVAGQINGNIESTEKTELRAGARVTGDIHCPKIAVAEDCFFQGEIKMQGGPEGHLTFTEKRQKRT
ncbi:MAG: polymer-forming cytoskeletal protein [Desulfobacteraceae bacterium]|jgi:cytoskeletal protein CcmA (bactofilin family)